MLTWDFIKIVGMTLAGVFAFIGLQEFIEVEWRAWKLRRRDKTKIHLRGPDQPQ